MIRRLTRNLGWKLFSLAAAFGLWLALSGARESTTSITVPVQYRNIPKNLEISSEIVEQAHLVLRGPSAQLSRLSGATMPIVFDLANFNNPGESTLTINKNHIALPPGVTLDRAIPGQVRLNLENRVTRAIPVHPRVHNVPEGARVATITVTPETLVIIGPASRVNNLEKVETDSVDVRTLDPNGQAMTVAIAGDAHVNFSGSPRVTVRVVLAPREPGKD